MASKVVILAMLLLALVLISAHVSAGDLPDASTTQYGYGGRYGGGRYGGGRYGGRYGGGGGYRGGYGGYRGGYGGGRYGRGPRCCDKNGELIYDDNVEVGKTEAKPQN